MKLYHGTNIQFGAIDLALCPPDRDFGRGFYTTSVKVHAERRAQDALLDYNEPVRYKVEALVADLTVALMQKYNLSKIDAMAYVYDSSVFAQLSDSSNKLYLKPWQEIYQMLKQELNIS